MSDYAIDVRNLNKSFKDLHVAKDVDLQVERGAIHGFLGPNGSGKTTTIRMLCGLLTPDSGSGTCLGLDLRKDSDLIKNKVGYMTQHFSLFKDMTVYENLIFSARCYGVANPQHAAARIMDRLNLKEHQSQLSGTLSGGWKQRLALANCLIHEPELLLLDEPTAGVDPKSRREFWQVLADLSSSGVTTLVSTHYMDEAERCTKLTYIINGSLKVSGSCQDIVANSGLVKFILTGPNVKYYLAKLEREPAVSQVAYFGNNLHVIGYQEKNLRLVFEKYCKDEVKIMRANPSIEDVFIDLVPPSKGGE